MRLVLAKKDFAGAPAVASHACPMHALFRVFPTMGVKLKAQALELQSPRALQLLVPSREGGN